jgi:hypothetical protein
MDNHAQRLPRTRLYDAGAAQEGEMGDNHRENKIRLTRISPAYWRVTFDLPPLNIFGPSNIPQLEAVVSSVESDDRVKVVVFDSAVDGFFLTHYDFLAKPEESAVFPPGATGLQPLPDMLAATAASCDLLQLEAPAPDPYLM